MKTGNFPFQLAALKNKVWSRKRKNKSAKETVCSKQKQTVQESTETMMTNINFLKPHFAIHAQISNNYVVHPKLILCQLYLNLKQNLL